MYRPLCASDFEFPTKDTTSKIEGRLNYLFVAKKREVRKTFLNDVCAVMENASKNVIRVAQQTMIAPRSDSPVLFVSTAANLRVVESKILTPGKQNIIVKRGITDILQFVHFYVVVTKLSNKPLYIPKYLVTAHDGADLVQVTQLSGPYKRMQGIHKVNAAQKLVEK